MSGEYNRRKVFLVYLLGTGSGLVSLTLACVLSSRSSNGSLEYTAGPSILATDLRKSATEINIPMV